MIFTTYFANAKNLPEDVTPVSIARYSPRWYNGLEYKALAPTSKMLKMDTKDYLVNFIEILQKLNSAKVLKELHELAGSEKIALLCYEKFDDEMRNDLHKAEKIKDLVAAAESKPDENVFCHRHLVSRWFQSHGIPCEEWLSEKQKKDLLESKQKQLFSD